MIPSRKNLFFLSAEQFQACVWHEGKMTEAQYFSNDTKGREQFAEFLQTNRHPSYLLIDVIEEDFRQETVPHMFGRNRKDMINRKFDQYYRGTPFLQARFLQRQEEGRRDDEMLFSALTNPARISPWLNTILTNNAPLTGIYSVPNISTPLIKGIEADHILLLSWEKNAGLRQTYFNKGHLHFSRLTPLSDSLSFSQVVSKETPRTQQYLKSLSLPPPGETLDVCIICNALDRSELREVLNSSSDLQYHYLDIQDMCKQFKSGFKLIDSDATPLFLHLLASRQPSSHYANAEHTHFFMLWKLNFALFSLATVTALVATIWSGIAFMQGLEYEDEAAPIIAQSVHVSRQANEIRARFPNTEVSATDMKTAVALMRKLQNYSPRPEEILLGLSEVLDKFTRVRTLKLAWQSSAADAAPSSFPAQVIIYDGELQDFGNNYRATLTYLDRFEQALVQHGYTIASKTLPIDVSSKGSISNSINLVTDKPAQFSMKIIWREKE
jgi:hypothetical protein